MDMPRIDFAAARKQVARGKSWAAVAREIGIDVKALRRRADPNFHEKSRAERATGDPSGIYLRRSNADFDGEKLLAQIPPDTRTPMERLMGIPLKGRSALDQKREEATKARQPVAPRLAYVRFIDGVKA